MPQNPLAATIATKAGAQAPAKLDAVNNLYVANGQSTALGVSALTLIKLGPGRAVRVAVTTAGAAGAIYDSATTGGIAAGNLIAVIPASVAVQTFDFPFTNGLVYAPGAAQVASICYS